MRTRTRAEPGSAAQIKAFVAKYGVKFTMMKKIEVNGDKAHAVFKWLKNEIGPEDIEWNFGKVRIGRPAESARDGEPLADPGAVRSRHPPPRRRTRGS